MNIECDEIFKILEQLIAIPSVSGDEGAVCAWLANWMQAQGWSVHSIPVEANRENLFVSFGVPRILFTTHVDVVPGPSRLFSPRRENDTLYGRGACDAKGCVALMLQLAKELRAKGYDNFGLLFVVGEEVDGVGARVSAEFLRNKGVQYLLNGEPTEARFAAATKGVLDFDVEFVGRSCHSGYPSYGEDANKLLFAAAANLYAANYGFDEVLGRGLINIGKVEAGSAANVISSCARMSCCVRTVEADNERVKALIRALVVPAIPVFSLDVPAITLQVPEWEADPYIAAYVSDIGQFSILNCEMYLCGPGSILCAHTDDERVSYEDMQAAYKSYLTLFDTLHRRH